MPIRRRVEVKPNGVMKPVVSTAPRQELPSTFLEWLKQSRAAGITHQNIVVPFMPDKYGLVAVSLDDLIMLAEKESITTSAGVVKKLKLKR
jgi:hypothetical protein